MKTANAALPQEGPIDIVFLSVDHYEPGFNTWKVKEWVEKYPLIARKHPDADGVVPQYTWFYPAEQFKLEQVEILADLSAAGYGEIELHLHHDHDTSETLRARLRKAKDNFSRVGALETVDGAKAFGFAHGNWALDDSVAHTDKRNPCGVTNELIVLREEGCYADFTFPSWGFESQPRQINSIYYATDDPDKPKSYDHGPPVTVGRRATGDLLIFEGPLSINFGKLRHHEFPYYYPLVETGEITDRNPPLPFRVDEWVRAGIHVEGRPSWIFVKTYAHGATDDARSALLGPIWENMHSYLGEKYNDGTKYRLHYVTAREAYNIVKAAEAGKSGNPGQYRDFVIPPYKTSLRNPTDVQSARLSGRDN
ncbi:hypothetical protein HZA56_10855 [Candidatus Poribacteria bacterium]|nr:hypothetical protein [Candidatus Poribacteria bacterium]